MPNKALLFSFIYLLSPLHIDAFGSWIHDAMHEMEEHLSHMQKMVDQTFTQQHKHNDNAQDSLPAFSLSSEENGVSLSFNNVKSGDMHAHINDNVVEIKHADFKTRITQLKNRLSKHMLLVENSTEKHVSEETDDQSSSQAFYSSSSQNIPLSHEVDLNSIDISYNEQNNELVAHLTYKKGKNIPIAITTK